MIYEEYVMHRFIDRNGEEQVYPKKYYTTEDDTRFESYAEAKRYERELEHHQRTTSLDEPVDWSRGLNRREREEEEQRQVSEMINRMIMPQSEPKVVTKQIKKRDKNGREFIFEKTIPVIEEPKDYEVKKGAGRKIFVLKEE